MYDSAFLYLYLIYVYCGRLENFLKLNLSFYLFSSIYSYKVEFLCIIAKENVRNAILRRDYVAQLKYWQWISVPLSIAELRDVKS